MRVLTKVFVLIIVGLFFLLSFNPLVIAETEGEHEEFNDNIIYVNKDGTADYTTIKEAVQNAEDGDTIFVYSGTYIEDIIVINKTITLIGEDKHSTIIKNSTSWWTLVIKNCNVTIKEFTLMSKKINKNEYYGPIRCFSSNVIISDNIIRNSMVGILIHSYSKHDYVIIKNNTFINNYVAINTYKHSNIENNIFKGNFACLQIISGGNRVIKNNIFEYNIIGITFRNNKNDNFSFNDFMFNGRNFALLQYSDAINQSFYQNYYGRSRTLPYPIRVWDWKKIGEWGSPRGPHGDIGIYYPTFIFENNTAQEPNNKKLCSN